MQAFESGPLAGIALNEANFNWAKRRYYELMKWDPETGAPTEACLRELRLDELLRVGEGNAFANPIRVPLVPDEN
jgi:aldehyde:ferredoxin oxidoreductase